MIAAMIVRRTERDRQPQRQAPERTPKRKKRPRQIFYQGSSRSELAFLTFFTDRRKMKAISLEKVVNDVEIWVLFASENYVWGTWNRLHLSGMGDTERAR